MPEPQVLRAKVAGAQQQDVGKGIVRLGLKQIRALGLSRGDVVEVKGKRATAAIAVPLAREDEGIDVVRMDGLVRGNAQVGIGDTVEIRKAPRQEAKKVVLAPAKQGLRIAGSGESLRPTLLYRPFVDGDLISTSVFQQPQQSMPSDLFSDDFFRAFFGSPAFGLMEIRLVVVSTQPRGIVRVVESTEIELAPERAAPGEAERLTVTYDDLGGLKPVL